MAIIDFLQILFYLVIVVLLTKPLGIYMASVYEGNALFLGKIISPVERLIYRICRINPKEEMNWKTYASSMLIFSFFGIILLHLILSLQKFLPLNPQDLDGMPFDLAFNTAVSFTSNTNWQAYGGENTLSYFSQMTGLTVQNFLSAATGMSILMAFIRGIVRRETSGLGNFWVDTLRGILYILLPLCLIFSLILVSQGVIQNFKNYEKAEILEEIKYELPDPQHPEKKEIKKTKEQTIPMGPVASQIAIKQLGTNGGGFFNVNSAHPFENPTPISNFLEILAILLIPAALCYTFGLMVQDTRQGWALFIAMFLILTPMIFLTIFVEYKTTPSLPHITNKDTPHFPNMEGKETRFGVANSSIWAVATTATGNGSVNTMHDSFTPLGGMLPLWLIQTGEVVFGGVGSGLYGILVFVLVTVFVAGLMIGRTPTYLGKKIEPFEMKMASIVVLLMPVTVLLATAVAVMTEMGRSSIANPGIHGFTEILYAFSSMTNNNGSAFAGLNANTPFYNYVGAFTMLIGRFVMAIPILAIAGSLAQKKPIVSSAGTLHTHTLLFVLLLISIILIIGSLTFFPASSLGPIVEHLTIIGGTHGH